MRTWEGWLYLAVVIDLFSRRVVGWSMQSHLRTDLVLDALMMAVGQRLPGPGLLSHSDRGAQYTSDDYQRALRDHRIACSMSGRGNCWDNAAVESFFGTLKRELVYRRTWPTRREDAAASTSTSRSSTTGAGGTRPSTSARLPTTKPRPSRG